MSGKNRYESYPSRREAVLDGAEAVGLPRVGLAFRRPHRNQELVGAAHLKNHLEPYRRLRRSRRRRRWRRTRGQQCRSMLGRGLGDSWALGEPPLGGGVVGWECGRSGGGEDGGVGGRGGGSRRRGRGFGKALALLKGREAICLGAATLLLCDPHGLRSRAHGSTRAGVDRGMRSGRAGGWEGKETTGAGGEGEEGT